MTRRKLMLTTAATVLLFAGVASALAGVNEPTATYDPPVSLDITFVRHIDDNFVEQDVFVEKEAGSGKIYRPGNGERDMSQPLYAATIPLKQDPFDANAIGPWPKGRSLDLTLGEWFEARGQGKYTCANGEGHIKVNFTGLVPEGVYTMWHYFLAWPPTDPFIGTYDIPIGDRDGSQSVFRADAAGKATFERSFKPCLQLTGEHLASGLAIAWHSDGKTYGAEPGEFGTYSHVQLYVDLPKRSGI